MKKVCKNCRKEIDDDSNFCKHCGTNLKNNTDNNKEQLKKSEHCYECGYAIVGDSKFCSECGIKIKK